MFNFFKIERESDEEVKTKTVKIGYKNLKIRNGCKT